MQIIMPKYIGTRQESSARTHYDVTKLHVQTHYKKSTKRRLQLSQTRSNHPSPYFVYDLIANLINK